MQTVYDLPLTAYRFPLSVSRSPSTLIDDDLRRHLQHRPWQIRRDGEASCEGHGEEPFEIIGMHHVRSLAEGYNSGLEKSKSEIVAFCHDDIEFLGSEIPERIKRHLGEYDVIGVAGTDLMAGTTWGSAGLPHLFGQVAHRSEQGLDVCIYGAPARVVGHIQALDGLFVAFRREVIQRVKWDAQTFDGFHFYDLDCTYRAYLMGYRLAVACDLPMYHASSGHYGEDWQKYAQRFLRKHGDNLAKRTPYRYNVAGIQVKTKLEALEVMTPSYWD